MGIFRNAQCFLRTQGQSKANSEVKNVLKEPFGRTLIIPAPLPGPSVNTVVPVFNKTHVCESKAPVVNAFSAFVSPDARSRSARSNCRSGLQARYSVLTICS